MLQGAGDSRLPVLNNHSTISSLVAFKPRQVLLAEQQNRSKMPKTRVLEDDHKLALLHSVVKYFSTRVSKKTLKKIIKDSQVEDGAWEASVDLEEMYGKYLENSKNDNTSTKDLGEPGKKTNEDSKKDDETELKSKKEKKKNKKSKLTSESRDENGTEEVILPAVSEKQVVPKEVPDVAEIAADQNNSEPKEKKKKKKNVPLDNGAELVNKEQSPNTLVNGTDDKSKKRKRSTSDDTEDKQVEVEVTEDSKRRKTEAVNAQQTEVKTFSGESNADLKSPCPSSEKKTVKKQQNGSVEPKTVNAFQRVKPDTVKYADERLTDNSYWAKDGAETGYGAKAQEILGQVKGRDFRHEKTKKKRGSYRGGQIDLQSHSVKFNYSDEE